MSQPPPLTIDQALTLAEKEANQGNTAAAIQIYSAVLQKQPEHSVAKKALHNLKQTSQKNQLIQNQISSPAQGQINSLINLYHSGQLSQLELDCEELLKRYPESIIVLNILGATFQSQNKMEKALACYESAIEFNPKYSEGYYNRASALKELGQLQKAVESYNHAIQIKPDYAEAYNNCGVALLELGKLQEAVVSCDKAVNIRPDYAEAYVNGGAALAELGELEKAVDKYQRAIQIRPNFAEAHNSLGNGLKALGKLEEAIASYDAAIKVNSEYIEAYYNRGIGLKSLGQLEKAVEDCDKAISLKYDYIEAYCLRGILLQELKRPNDAVESFQKAIQLKPEYAAGYSGLGNVLKELGKPEEAIAHYNKAILCKPDFATPYYNLGVVLNELGLKEKSIANYQQAVSLEPRNGLFWAGFASVLSTIKLTSYSDDFARRMLLMLEQPTIFPRKVTGTMISTLRLHATILSTLEQLRVGPIENVADLVAQLSDIPLLLRVMELSPIVDLEIENMLTKIREAVLARATTEEETMQGLPFYAALAMHSYANEYVFSESEEERQKIELLQAKVKACLERECAIDPSWLAVLGAYRSLYSYSWADKLLTVEWPEELQKVIVCQIKDIEEEHSLRSGIPCLSAIEDEISQLVRDQYEENPYPRWVKSGLSDKPRTIEQVCELSSLHLDLNVQQFSVNPEILIAGCGTGQHALGVASRFLDCNVLAVDLSLSSLSYAKRKTKELGVTNIEYMQADILKLNQLDRQFDIVESAGVLHHMENPLAGWKVLVERLRTKGLMKIALYSETARKGIVEARNIISHNKYAATPEGIRLFRSDVINRNIDFGPEFAKILKMGDFYTLSECRDLLFHVQEHRFTLPQIEAALSELGLDFIGFEFAHKEISNKFKEMFPEEESLVSLSKWHLFELENPDTFIGMYQFWLQKH